MCLSYAVVSMNLELLDAYFRFTLVHRDVLFVSFTISLQKCIEYVLLLTSDTF